MFRWVFIEDRFILDGVATAQEIITNCFNNKVGRRGSVETRLCKKSWMQTVLFGGKSQILVNGKPGRIILSKRGLRLGDPLSPLLFVLAADSFTKMLNLVDSKGLLMGLGPEGFN